MSVAKIRAYVECDGCAGMMVIDLDPAVKIPTGWDLIDVAIDAVRGGTAIRAFKGKETEWSDSTSVQDGKALCPKCTEEADGAAS